ncbi:hypothetical protein BS47DRAFT_1340179 [Hydnum rufescens UP504]|uniref:Uncharacterized protein n=1 Tax=Hydnum rufescens UP504 TaxID=1448309 RepID=A0A9P6B376_9AGAM|nr:hypothetical protein BS47DRAFT_1340179 [Hydnum rufescens UP504]
MAHAPHVAFLLLCSSEPLTKARPLPQKPSSSLPDLNLILIAEKRSDPVPTVAHPSQVADALDQLNHPKTEVLAQTEVPVGPPSIDYPPPFDDPHFKRHKLNSHINIYFSHKSHLCNVIIILMSDHRSSPMKTFKTVIAECGPISVSRAKFHCRLVW